MAEILLQPSQLNDAKLLRATQDFLVQNPEAAAVLDPAGGLVGEEFEDLVSSTGKTRRRIAKPYMYQYERAPAGLPLLRSKVGLVGKVRVDFITRMKRQLQGQTPKEPIPRVTSTTNSKLNKHRILKRSGPDGKSTWVRQYPSEAKRVLSWSMTAGMTCPGSSSWCAANCYAKKGRFDPLGSSPSVYWVYEWHRTLFENEPKALQAYVLHEMDSNKCKAFRIHPSGDFYSNAYLRWWIDTIKRAHEEIDPDMWFWFYTRMWWSGTEGKEAFEARVGSTWATYQKNLRKLYRMRRVVGWASMDPTMPLPPKGWRRAWIATKGSGGHVRKTCSSCRARGPVVFVEGIDRWLCAECIGKDRKILALYQRGKKYTEALSKERMRCPSQRWGNVWNAVKSHFSAWPQKIPQDVPERIRINGRDVVVRKELKLPSTCQECRFCFTPRLRNMIFGEH